MALSKSKFIFLIFIFLFCGCPYDSVVPLSDPARAAVDKDLIGKWIKEEKNEKAFLVIDQFNGQELILLIVEDGGKKIDRMRAFTTVVDGEKFLNVQEIKDEFDKRKWLFVNYKVSGGVMSLKTVEDKILKKPAKDSDELFALIKKNIKNKDLYDGDDVETLKRVKE